MQRDTSKDSSGERKRFIWLNKAIAALLVLLVCLVTANAALAWLSDTDEISNDLSIKEMSKSYASVIRPADGSEKTILVFGHGEPAYSESEIVETFYDIENLASNDIPWAEHITEIDSVIVDGAIAPADMSNWFKGAENLTNVDLSGISAEKLANTTGMFSGCSSLEKITVPPTFHFVGSPDLPAPDQAKVPDADGSWYLLDESEYNEDPKTPDDITELIESRYGTDQSTTIYAYGRGYAAVYGGTTLVFGRGIPSETYKDLPLNATYRGIETGSEDFNKNATSYSQNQPWRSYGLRSVESIASHKISTPSIAYWFSLKSSITSIDLFSIDFSECTTMVEAFYNCTGITRLDVSDWDVSNVQTLNTTFSQCRNLEILDVSNWNLPKLGSSSGANGGPLYNTFASCAKLEVIDTSNWNVATTDDFFRGANNSRRPFIAYCTNLKEIDLSGITITEGSATTSNRNWWTFTGCPNLEKLTVPSSFCTGNTDILSALNSNRNGYVNSNYWYEEGQGPALDGADIARRMQELFSDESSPEKTTFYSFKNFTDEDTYAAYYVAASGDKPLVFGRGSQVPESYEGATLSNVYREIETRCGGSQSATPWYTINRYITRVIIDTDLIPQSCGWWFADATLNRSFAGLDRITMDECLSAERMFAMNRSIEQLDLPVWDFAKCKTFAYMFREVEKPSILDVSGWTISGILDRDAFTYMFSYCKAITELDMSNWTLQTSTNQTLSFNDAFGSCFALKKVSFPHLREGVTKVSGNVGGPYYFGGTFYQCYELQELIVPNDFSFNSVIIQNGKDGIGNVITSGWWYEDHQGEGHTAEMLQNELSSRFRSGDGESHWYVERYWTDTDAYAAIYGDTIVFDRGAQIPDTYQGKAFETGYRELESASFSPKWLNNNNGNTTIVSAVVNAEIYPKSLSRWFYRFNVLESVDGIENLNPSNATNFSEMFYGCFALRELDLSGYAIEATPEHNFNSMFVSCESLTSLDLSQWTMPKWTRSGPTSRIFSSCSKLEEVKLSSTFNFSDLDANVSSGGIGFPGKSTAKDGFLRAACWYENGQGRPYAYFDAGKVVNDRFDTKSEPTTWTRYPIEDAYAAVYKDMFTNEASLVFGRGALAEVQSKYPDKQLQGIALGFEYYSFNGMASGTSGVPWSAYAGDIKEVIVEDAVSTVDMQQWFENFTKATTFDLAKLDTSKCTTLWMAFAGCQSVEELDLSTWDTSSLTTYGGGGYRALFYNCLKLKKVDISSWDFSAIRDRSTMFAVCFALEEIDMSNCVYENAPVMTYQCDNLQKVSISSNVSFAGDFFAPAVPSNENGFDGNWYDETTHEVFTAAQAKDHVNARYKSGEAPVTFITGYGRSAYAALYKATGSEERKLVFGRGFADMTFAGYELESVTRGLEASVYNTPGTSPASSKVPWSAQRGRITEVVNVVPADDRIKPLSLNAWFYDFNKITSLDLSMFDVSDATDISSMLYSCTSLSEIRGLASWNTAKIAYMDNAFAGPTADFATSIASWDTSSLKSMNWIFWGAKGLTDLDLSRWNTVSLESNVNAFYQCSNLVSLKLPANFVKASMTNLGQMFMECGSLITLDTSDWNTSGLTNLNSLFYNCNALQTVIGIERWNTSSATSMRETFHNCYAIVADLSGWNVSNVTDHALFNYAAASTLIEPNWTQTAMMQSEDPDAADLYSVRIMDEQSESLAMTSTVNYAPERYVAAPNGHEQINAVVKLEPVSVKEDIA